MASITGNFMSGLGMPVVCLEDFSLSNDLFVLPSPELVSVHSSLIFSTSLAVCLLCLLEGLSIGKSLSARAGGRIDTNQETFSIGMGNLGCGLFSGMPASGSLTRSTLSVASGANSNAANLLNRSDHSNWCFCLERFCEVYTHLFTCHLGYFYRPFSGEVPSD